MKRKTIYFGADVAKEEKTITHAVVWDSNTSKHIKVRFDKNGKAIILQSKDSG